MPPVQKQDDKDKAPAPSSAAVDPATTTTVADHTGGTAFDTSTKGAIDPRTGVKFQASAGLAGLHASDAGKGDPKLPAPSADLGETAASGAVPVVDPKRIPAEVTPGVSPDAGGDALLAAAQARAPSLTAEFVAAYGLTDADLGAIARGEVPPPPTPGPVHSADLYLTPGGWQQTPPGVPPGDVGKNAIAR